MIGYLLITIRIRFGFSRDMMAAAMGLERMIYDKLECQDRMATNDERTLLESMCQNLSR